MRTNRQSFSFRRSIRLPDYDYSQAGAYFVTLCSHRKACIFGEIIDGDMRLNALGSIVSLQWQRTAHVRTSVKLDAFAIMPNHVHGILFIHVNIIRDTPYPSAKRDPKQKAELHSGSLGAIIGQFKSAVTRQARRLEGMHDVQIWQRNYYEHVIRSEESLYDIRKYIAENPSRWSDDSLYVE